MIAVSWMGLEDEFTGHYQWDRWVQEESLCCGIQCAGDRQRFVMVAM